MRIERAPVMMLDDNGTPSDMYYPCPSAALAEFNVIRTVPLFCGHLEGHQGPHEFHLEWIDELTTVEDFQIEDEPVEPVD